MNITIITMGRTSAGQGKYYNLQDAGLAKALAERGHSVKVYNFIAGDADHISHVSENMTIFYLPAKAVGFHTIHSFDFIADTEDVVVCYSDNQLLYRKVVRVCKKKGVLLIPYIGVVGSHNRNPLVSKMMDFVIPNQRIYRRQHVLAKTPAVKRQMEALGIHRVTVAPACLDTGQVQSGYRKFDADQVKAELGLPAGKKIILFIGRMIEEKRPEDMLTIFAQVYGQHSDAHLVMIGKGVLLELVKRRIEQEHLTDCVTLVPQIANDEIWKYYVAADVYANLNKVEIFGMAMLEAMYYECPVVAWRAPGPDYIFKDRVNGYLCDSRDAMVQRIGEILEKRPEELIQKAKQRVEQDFMWESTANIIEKLIRELKNE
jgi:1,2-diacylglycerol 3-alpha-glucosyltransferase